MKKLIIAAICTMASVGANAQLLWKISGNGAKETSYLFGTHHVAPISMIDSISGAADALNSVQTVMGEVDMISDPMGMQQIAMAYALAPADSTLTKVMTADELSLLDSVLAKYSDGQLTSAMLDPMKPAMVGTQIAMLQTLTAFPGFNPQEQLDQTIQQKALANGKKVEGLESIESQFKILLGNPISEQVKALVEGLDKDDEAIVKVRKLANAYRTQNLDAINNLILDSDDMDPDDIERLMINRNNNWVKTLQTKLPEETVFFAVGVGHFVGEHGLINQLKKLGYNVEPVQ